MVQFRVWGFRCIVGCRLSGGFWELGFRFKARALEEVCFRTFGVGVGRSKAVAYVEKSLIFNMLTGGAH